MSDNYALADGTTTEYSTDAGTTWTALAGLKDIGQVGEEGSFVDVSALSDTVNKYIAGTSDTPELTLSFYRDVGNTAQQAFFTLAQTKKNVLMRLTFTAQDDSTETMEFDMALAGVKHNVQKGSAIMSEVKAKQSGQVTIS